MKLRHTDVAAIVSKYEKRLGAGASARSSCCVCGKALSARAPIAMLVSRICDSCRDRSELAGVSGLIDHHDQEWSAGYPESGLSD